MCFDCVTLLNESLVQETAAHDRGTLPDNTQARLLFTDTLRSLEEPKSAGRPPFGMIGDLIAPLAKVPSS